PLPLQSKSWISVPLAVPPPLVSMHLPSARSDPSALSQVQFCAALPLHVKSWIAVPLAVPASASSTHSPPSPKIGPSPRYFTLTTDGVSKAKPASIDWARRRYCPSAQLSGAALPVGRPSAKQEELALSQTCSGTK